MRRASCIGLLVLASCQQILGLHDLGGDAAVHAGDALGDATDGDAPLPIDDAPGPDTDGDGVPDSRDNCPTVPNADQHDWDHDGHGDACDHCPYIADGSDPDTDGDGVGDACDPSPSTAGDRRALWEAFYDDVTTGSGAWIGSGGTWTVSGGELHQTSNTVQLAAIGPAVVVGNAYIVAQIHVDAVGAKEGSVNPAVGVASTLAGTNQNAQAFGCYVDNNGQNEIGTSQNAMEASQDAWAGTFANGQTVQIIEHLTNNTSCEAFEGSASGSARGPGAAGSGTIQLATAWTAASFEYVFVVDTSAEN